ncbi:MAG: hypothetical protein BIFFINMI_02563 [Phycisphaerae bacterium]|nr:hypothetical protein [Phycisphaerae bacterium]
MRTAGTHDGRIGAESGRTAPRTRSGRWAAVVLALLLACPALSQAAGLLVPTGADNSLAIANQKVVVHINNGIAVTTVDQTFRNHSNVQLEAMYRFPVPARASVSNFSMWINGKEVVGEVLEREKAREIYRQVTSTRRDPGLLEQVNYKWFEMRVFPVPANGEQRIQIAYYQPADYDAGNLVYTYPLEVEGVANAALEGDFSVLVDVQSNIPMKRVYSPSHEKDLLAKEAAPGRYRAGLEVAKGRIDRDFVLVCELQREETGVNLVTSRRDGGDGYFMLQITPSEKLDRVLEPANYLFVLDVSGSMRELGKLALARAAADQMLTNLRPEDTFNVISFNIAPEGMAKSPMHATDENKAKARRYMAELKAAGGTDLVPALELAAEQQDPQLRNAIVLLSDGQATGSEDLTGYLQILHRRQANSTVFSFGIGNEINRPLLSALADKTGGYADFVSGQDDLGRKVAALQMKIQSPVMRDLTIDWGDQKVSDVLPAPLPNIYRGQRIVLYGRYSRTSASTLSIGANVDGRAVTFRTDATWPKQDVSNPEIERMWAQNACETLGRRINAGEGGDRERKQIVDLATKFSIVTPYTAFLVLEDEDAYRRFNIERLNADRVEAERLAQQQRYAWSGEVVGGPAVATGNSTPASPASPSSPSNSQDLGGGGVEWVFVGAFTGLLALGWPRRRWSRS